MIETKECEIPNTKRLTGLPINQDRMHLNVSSPFQDEIFIVAINTLFFS